MYERVYAREHLEDLVAAPFEKWGVIVSIRLGPRESYAKEDLWCALDAGDMEHLLRFALKTTYYYLIVGERNV